MTPLEAAAREIQRLIGSYTIGDALSERAARAAISAYLKACIKNGIEFRARVSYSPELVKEILGAVIRELEPKE